MPEYLPMIVSAGVALGIQACLAIWTVSKVSTLVEVNRESIDRVEKKCDDASRANRDAFEKLDREKVDSSVFIAHQKMQEQQGTNNDREHQRHRHEIRGLDQRVRILEK